MKRLLTALAGLSILVALPSTAQPPFSPRGIELSNGEEKPEGNGETAPVTFGEPFTGIDDALDGKSIEVLISGSPLFSPIEGLPDAVWQDKQCSACHEWTQETLCTQGQFYTEKGLDAVNRKQHPYGGAFKREVMGWAARGCE